MTSQQAYAGYWTCLPVQTQLCSRHTALCCDILQAQTLYGKMLLYVSCADVLFLDHHLSSSQASKGMVDGTLMHIEASRRWW